MEIEKAGGRFPPLDLGEEQESAAPAAGEAYAHGRSGSVGASVVTNRGASNG